LRMRSMCLLGFLLGLLPALPAAAQQASTASNAASLKAAVASDKATEQILLDRINELEKRVAELEASKPSSATVQPAATLSDASILTPTTQTLSASTSIPATPAAQGQDSSAAPAAQPPVKDPPTWSIGPIDFSGAIDGYYNWNFNHPATRENPGFYNFAIPTNQFSLSLAKLDMSHSPDPIGFEFDFGYGETMKLVNGGDNDGGFNQYVEQAYVSLKPKQLKGLQLDFGKFVTSAGAEVIESYNNWNYSRSLLFALAIPYYHFGLRTSFPVGSHFTGGFQVVNGWNNVVDNNTGKTIGVTGAVNFSKASWFINYYGGPENTDTNTGWRHLFDTTLLLTPSSKFGAYINYDYGQNRDAFGNVATTLSHWQGVAAALHFQATSKWAFTPRIEYFSDPDGFSTSVVQALKEFTITGEYKILDGLMWRAEYRHDWSNQPSFERGFDGTSKDMDTATIALIGYFGPKR
jgi:Putative beta-barrel porin-2, OmpL-like. bbp2